MRIKQKLTQLVWLGKIQRYGLTWTATRIVRELIRPSTRVGSYLKPFSTLFYRVLSQPIHFINNKISSQSTLSNTLYFFYDFDIEPITYDFVWALSVAYAKKEALKLAYLQVILVPGRYEGLRKELPDYEESVNFNARIWRIYSILLPSIKLLPATGVTLCSDRSQAMRAFNQAKHIYPLQYNVTFPIPYAPELAAVYGPSVRQLRADKQAVQYVSRWMEQHCEGRKAIVITLRHYAYTPERNSNMEAWLCFANEIKENYFVIFISDVEQALQPLDLSLKQFMFFNQACWNLNLRMALYELAYLNLGVNTGPMALCWFNPSCRYITFKVAVKNVPNVPLKMITDKGFTPNENAPFSGPFQKWVWEDDDLDVIKTEFALMCKSIT